MKEENNQSKKRRIGRKPKNDRSNHRYTVNLNSQEDDLFKLMLSRAGETNISKYIHHALFDKEMKVVTIDKAAMDYYMRLTNFYHQFQAIGNNYNQTVRAIKTNFGEKRAYQMLSKLENLTFELVKVSKKIIELTDEYETKWLQK